MLQKVRSVINIINLVLERDENLSPEGRKRLIEAKEELYQLLDSLLQVKGISREISKISRDLSQYMRLERRALSTSPINALELLRESAYVECVINPEDPEKITVTKVIPRYQIKEAEPLTL